MSYTYEYPRPAVAVDIVAFIADETTKILLIERGHEPYKGMWALPGGHVEPKEDLPDAAVREFEEEVGIGVPAWALTQLGAYGKPGRDPRGDNVSIAFTVFLRPDVQAIAGDDAAKAQWFPIDQLPPLAFDHATVIADAMRRHTPAPAYTNYDEPTEG